MANQPRPGSHKYTIRLNKEQVEALKTAKNRPEGVSDSAFLAELVTKGLEVPAPKAQVPAPKFDADIAQRQVIEHWDRGGKIVVTRILRLRWAELKTWLVQERLIGGI